ncbi:MAG: hypothetical protein JF628_06565 [Sphingomonas sp.]|nr:hypothetical protein [Sphingomonas sp.]
MNDAALQQLGDAQAALMAALNARDIGAIETANAAVATAVEDVRKVGGWREHPGLRDELIQVLKNAEAARGHINRLADQNRRGLDKLISLAGTPRAAAYGRSGKLS